MATQRASSGFDRRPLREPVPDFLERLVDEGPPGDRDVQLSVRSDISLDSDARPQWLVVTARRVLCGTWGDATADARVLARDAVAEVRIEGGVGAGLLQARCDGTWIDLVRFSNRRAFAFEAAARLINAARDGAPIAVEPADEADPRRCPACGLVLDTGGEACPRCTSRHRVLLRIVQLFAPYRGAALGMLGLLALGIALDLVSPQLTRYLVDTVLPGHQLQPLLGVVLVLALVQVARQVVNGCTAVLGSRVGTAITADMRARLVRHLQQLSIGFYDRQQVGALMGRVAYDTDNLHDFVSQVTGGFLLQVLMIAGVGLMMFSIDPLLATVTLVPAPLVVLGTVFFWRTIYPRYDRVWDAAAKQAGMLTGLLSGIRVVKAFHQEGRQEEKFARLSARVRGARRDVEGAIAAFNPVMGVVFQLGGWIVWYVGGREVIGGRLTLGALMAFFGYLWMFYGPLGMLPQFTNWLSQFLTQINRLFEILDTPRQIPAPERPVHVAPVRGAIRFEDVSFGYGRHAPVLGGLSLEIRPGEMVGLVGASGSGKSTIVNLLCRFYDVDGGRVTLDGVDVRRIPEDELRGAIGVALQEAFLFRGSIWDNIAFGRPGATPEEVLLAARAADCHDFVLRHPHGYDSWVGEGGSGLSGGEKQRLGIARVLLADPRVLVLDESTSSVDGPTEASIQRALGEVMRGRTTLAIAHRLGTLRGADRIFVLEGGRIVESGPPDELLRQGGRFARMIQPRQGESGPSARARFTPRVPEPPVHHPRWLDPASTTLARDASGALTLSVDGAAPRRGVFAVACLPVQYPGEYVALRAPGDDGREAEAGLVRRLADWPPGPRELIERALLRRTFVQTIRRVVSIELVNNYLDFEVETDLGPQRFTLRWQQERAQDYGPRGKLLIDTEENRYLVPDVDALPAKERRLFLRYVYW